MTLIRIDEALINYDFFDSLYEAEASLFGLAPLLMTYIAYACTVDGGQQSAIFPSWDAEEIPNKLIPKIIDDGYVFDFSLFKISSERLIDALLAKDDGEGGIPITPRPGVNLCPIYLFDREDAISDLFEGAIFFKMNRKIEGVRKKDNDSEVISELTPVKNINDLKPTDILSSSVLIKPRHYEMMTQELLAVTSFRLSVFQPILAGCGVGCIQLPIVDDNVWLPGVGVLKTCKSESHRKTLAKFDDVMLQVENYIFETRAKLNVLYDELERRRGLANPPDTIRIQEMSPDGSSSTIETVKAASIKQPNKHGVKKKTVLVHHRWSKIMTKKDAASKLGWTMHDLRMHLAYSPELAHQVRGCRQRWRFDCDDPSFASLPVDEAYNNTLAK